MIKIVIASNNPVKIHAALRGFQKAFPGREFEAKSIQVASGVSDQPMTDEETLQGAQNRVTAARTLIPDGDFWVGIEGGVEWMGSDLAVFAWIVIESQEISGKGKTGTFFLPPKLTELVRSGKELGEADDIFFNRKNSKQENGAIGILTKDLVDRRKLYEMAVIFALLPFINQDIYLSSSFLPK
jgi:inosine/xanthosine triphosphatase